MFRKTEIPWFHPFFLKPLLPLPMIYWFDDMLFLILYDKSLKKKPLDRVSGYLDISINWSTDSRYSTVIASIFIYLFLPYDEKNLNIFNKLFNFLNMIISIWIWIKMFPLFTINDTNSFNSQLLIYFFMCFHSLFFLYYAMISVLNLF